MNLQRREEIRAISASLRMMPLNEAAGAIDELLAHIDTLEQTAAERVIADGSRGLTLDYTGEGSAWVPPVEARAVVVPPLTPEWCDEIWRNAPRNVPTWAVIEWICKQDRERFRAIPADRVLGEEMVAVKWISVDEALPEDRQTVGFVTECSNDRWYHGRVLGGRYRAGEFGGFSVPGLTVQASHWFAFPPLPDALRASQGGAAT